MRLKYLDFADKFINSTHSKKILLDVRNKDEVENGSLPGSIHIPLAELESRINELSPDQQIFVYCKAGGRAEKAGAFLLSQGYRETFCAIEGGYENLKNKIGI